MTSQPNERPVQMDRDRNLIFGILAAQLHKVPPSRLAEAAQAWAQDPRKDLGRLLVEKHAVSEGDYQLLAHLVEEAIRACGGNSTATLAAFGGERQVYQSFRGSLVLRETGDIETVAAKSAGNYADPESVPAVHESPGRYEGAREYDRGGMGRILLVHDEFLGRDIALKELLPDMDADDGSTSRSSVPHMTRFLQEARITGQLEHPGIVPVYEIGHRSSGALYYTMKFVRGRTLSEAIANAGSIDERLKLLPHFVDLCQAIAYAHSRGVIHRDIKPGNVMVGEFGETVVLDWGVAKAKNAHDVHAEGLEEAWSTMNLGDTADVLKTAYGQALGTPAYMPPEQAEGDLDNVDEQSDVYSLGAALHELLTGYPPYIGGSAHNILWKVLTEDPPDPVLIEPAAPPELVAICRRAMRKDKTERYASAKALAEEVERFQSGRLVQTYAYKPGELFLRFVKRQKAILATAAVALIVLLATGVASYRQVVSERDGAIAARQAEAHSRREAEQQRENARDALKQAQRAREDAEKAREDAEKARRLAERESYRSSVRLAQEYVEDGFYDLANEVLWRAPEGERDWEWGYLLGLCNQGLYMFAAHNASVWDIAVGPDSARLATAALDATASVWNLRSGDRVAALEGHKKEVNDIAFSPSGDRLVTASWDKTARVWDADTGAALVVLEGHLEGLKSAMFSPDGAAVLTAASDGEARIWDAETGAVLLALTGHQAPLRNACFSPDGASVLTAAEDGSSRVWDAATGALRFALDEPTAALDEFGLSGLPSPAHYGPGGAHIITAPDDAARLWDAETGELLFTLTGHQASIRQALFNHAGDQAATLSWDNTAMLWSVATGELLATLEGHESAIMDAAFDPDGRFIATASEDETVKIWSPLSGKLLETLPPHDAPVRAVAFTPDGARLLCATQNGAVKIWDANAIGQQKAMPFGQPHAFEKTGNLLLAMSSDNAVRVWTVDKGTELASFTCFTNAYQGNCADISAQGARVITLFNEPGAAVSNVWVWDVTSRSLLHRLDGHRANVNDVAFSPVAGRAATASDDKTVKLWDTDTGAELLTFTGLTAFARSAAFSPSGALLAVGLWDDAVHVFKVESGEEAARLPEGSGGYRVAFVPGAETPRLLTASVRNDGLQGKLWDLAAPDEPLFRFADPIETFEVHEAFARMPFSTKGTRIAGVSNAVQIWDAVTGQALLALPGYTAALFHPGGRRLLVRSEQGAEFLRAEPFRRDFFEEETRPLPWRERYDLYRRARLAEDVGEESNVSARLEQRYDVAVTTRREAALRLRQLLEVNPRANRDTFEDLFGEESATAAEPPEPGWRVSPGLEAQVFARLCLQEGDRITAVNGALLEARPDGLAAIRLFLEESNKTPDKPLSLAIVRAGTPRLLRYHFLEPAVERRSAVFPRSTLEALLATFVPMLEDAAPEAFDDYDAAQAAETGEPVLDGAPPGFFIGSLEDQPAADTVLPVLGLEPGDRVTSAGPLPLRSSRDLAALASALCDKVEADALDALVLRVQRGQFHRIEITVRFED